MNKLYHVILLFYVCIVVFIFMDYGEANDETKMYHRQRRYLSFRNVSNFFLRLNFKANMVPWNQIFAQALGFRMNWKDPPDSFHPYHHLRLRRATLYNNLEILLDRNGLNGFHCVRRAVCEIESLGESREIYHKILKMVFRRQSSATDKWHNTTFEECQISISSCPFSLLEVSTYTDI